MDDRRERNTGRSGRESGSKRKIFRRTVFLMLVGGVGLFIPLIGQLWNIAIVHHEEYQAEAVEQQTRDVEVAAFRGSIYDSSGDVLAMSATVYNLILSPRDLEASVDESKYKDEEGNADLTAYQAALQAKKDLVLAVLDLDREALADRLERTYSQYEVLKTNIEKEQAEQLRAFITENKLSHFLYLTPTTKRYYPYGDLAAHVLGFCNSEGGAYGVEAIYNDVLEGTVGRVVTTRTGTGVAHCPASNMKLASGVALIPRMLELDVPVGLAVDGSASNDGSSLMEELRVCYLLHRLTSSEKAPSGYQVLKMATRGSARLLGREDIGQLAVGKCADLFLVDSRRLELVGGAYSPADVLATVGLRGPVDYTVVNGRVVVKEGHLVTIDEEKTAADARNACGAYLAKA